MSVPIKLRGDFSAGDVRAVARRCKDGAQVRRLLAIATILDGHSRSDAEPWYKMACLSSVSIR